MRGILEHIWWSKLYEIKFFTRLHYCLSPKSLKRFSFVAVDKHC